MNKKLVSILILLGLWTVLALSIHSDVILPTPLSVLTRLIELMQTSKFYTNLFTTFLRAHLAFGMSLLIGIGLALICYRWKKVEEILSIWIKGLQTIPQISFIILLYFWLSNEWCVYVVIILMAFPITYFNYLEHLNNLSHEYTDIIQLTNHSWWDLVFMVYLPLCHPSLMATIKSGLPLSLKVCVMSEVLIYTSVGIGKQISLAKTGLDMVSVFSWTFALITLITIEMEIIRQIEEKLMKD